MSSNGKKASSRDSAKDSKNALAALRRGVELAVLLLLVALVLSSAVVVRRPGQILLAKLFAIAFLSLFPGWLYLQFLALKGAALYDEYVLNLYRLKIDQVRNLPKPPPGSSYWHDWVENIPEGTDPANNIYLRKFETVYGRAAVPRRARVPYQPGKRRRVNRDESHDAKAVRRVKGDNFSPALLATAMFCIGWTGVLYPESYKVISWFGNLSPSGLPRLPGEALAYGFVGSYSFILQTIVRRYVQADLKSHTYVIAIARVTLVAAIVSVTHLVWPEEWSSTEPAFAFFVGFFPELGFRLLQQLLYRTLRLRQIVRVLDDPYPLSDLDGLNLWWQSRLLEEGIEDMQNLTTANLVDLMLHTRVPLNRLVDWIDQAYLYLRLAGSGPGGGKKGGASGEVGGGDSRQKLRRYGIRTATDLIDAFEGDATAEPFREGLRGLLDDGAGRQGISTTQCLLQTLNREPNLWHVRQWKQHEWLQQEGRKQPGGGQTPAAADTEPPAMVGAGPSSNGNGNGGANRRRAARQTSRDSAHQRTDNRRTPGGPARKEPAMDEEHRPEDEQDEELLDPPDGAVVADLGGGGDAPADRTG
jgi:hypothetical protein